MREEAGGRVTRSRAMRGARRGEVDVVRGYSRVKGAVSAHNLRPQRTLTAGHESVVDTRLCILLNV